MQHVVAADDHVGGDVVRPRAGVAGDMQAGVVVHPVHQALVEDRVRAGDAGRRRNGVANLARVVDVRDVDGAKPVAGPRLG